ncbi:MAG TPA: aromatic amino acid transport family protein [Victivallales bacterium]|nr:aromatic amino acid transport family protein [Victivallales bacterium]
MQGTLINRQIGSVFLIMGTEIGAGIQALPLLIAPLGIVLGSVLLIIFWAIMLYTALLICEATYFMDGNSTFASMAKNHFGKSGKFLMLIIFWFTLSSIIMAYISAAGSTFSYILSEPTYLASILFVIIFGIVIILGTKVVDYINRTLLSITIVALLVAIISLLESLKFVNLQTSVNSSKVIYVLPAIATAFIVHNIIPSISTYLCYNKKSLKRVVIIGSLIPLIIYVVWIFSIYGNIPQLGPEGFESIFTSNGANVSNLLNLIAINTSSKVTLDLINFIVIMSITAAFLGASISFFHFNQDILNRNQKSILNHFIVPAIITFIIPLFFVLRFPNIFISALKYAGIGAIILFIIFPVLITKIQLRSKKYSASTLLHNNIILTLVFLLGIGIIFIQIL